MSLLTMIQSVADRIGLPKPSAVIGATDQSVVTLLALAQEEGDELKSRGHWQELTTEATFATVASTESYALSTIASDYDYQLNDAMWNRTSTWPLRGPMTPQMWQQQKSTVVAGVFPRYRVRGGSILITPTPSAAENVYFEYQSKNWCESVLGLKDQEDWAADTDLGVLDEKLMAQGVRWRFLKSKGFDYAEEFRQYEIRLDRKLARDGTKAVLNMGSTSPSSAKILVPDGTWSL